MAEAIQHVRAFYDHVAERKLGQRRIANVGDFLDTALMEQPWQSGEQSRIILRRNYCDNLYPMPSDISMSHRTAILAARAQCMREREGYLPPRDAPPSKRFPLASAYAANPSAALFFQCRSCRRWIAKRVQSVCGDLPRVLYCECGDDRGAVRRVNAELERADTESRAFWTATTKE